MLSGLITATADQILYSSLLAVGALGASTLLGQRCPHLRYGLWWLVLIRLVVPPSLASPWSLRSLLERFSAPAVSPALSATAAPAEALSASFVTTPGHQTVEVGAIVLVSLWAIVAFLLLCRSLLAQLRLHRSLRQTEPVTSAALLSQAEEWRQRFHIHRPVALRTGDLGLVPFTAGMLRPVLYLPRPLVEQWRLESVEPVVAHEMAHVKRWDSLWLQVQAILGALYFFHPATWLAIRKVNGLREELCDRAALEAGTIPSRRYGGSLVAVLRLNLEGPAEVPAFCHDKRRLTMRLKMILKPAPALPRWISFGLTWAGLAMAGFLLLPMGQLRAESSLMGTAPDGTASSSNVLVAHDLSSPLAGSRLRSGFGDRRHPISGEAVFHRGVDLAAPSGAKVLAPAAGTVETATVRYEEGEDWGTVIVLDHGDGVKTLYAHLGELVAKTGTRVTKGQTIALVGSTGVSTGPHLHFEVWVEGKPVDPDKMVASW